jgi:glycosyltransferase involved in cell wall biosynthesis
MFSVPFSIYPVLQRRLGFHHSQLVLAPSGMLKASALQFKRPKKMVFLKVMKWLGIGRLLRFHATDETEWKDIQQYFGQQVKGLIAGNFPGQLPEQIKPLDKRPGHLSLLFIGRLHPVKNLDYLLSVITGLAGNVTLDIVGSEEDAAYTALCKQKAEALPANIMVRFLGEKPPQELADIIQQHHFLVLPTHGENFGHVIFEALSQGRPVIISDQTPWRNLTAKQAGWDLSLQSPEAWAACIQEACEAEQQTFDCWSKGAWQMAHDYLHQTNLKQAYLKLFS